jgi:hypothetical protein
MIAEEIRTNMKPSYRYWGTDGIANFMKMTI